MDSHPEGFNKEPSILETGPLASPRAKLLQDAIELVTKSRNNTYGPPSQDFARSAGMLNALGFSGPEGRPIRSVDIAYIIICVKLYRAMWSDKYDTVLDIAGYAACAWDCIVEELRAGGVDV